MGECELEPREGCSWPGASPGLLAKLLPAAWAPSATLAATHLLVGTRSPLAAGKELGFRSGTGGRSAREQPRGLASSPHPDSQSPGQSLPDTLRFG